VQPKERDWQKKLEKGEPVGGHRGWNAGATESREHHNQRSRECREKQEVKGEGSRCDENGRQVRRKPSERKERKQQAGRIKSGTNEPRNVGANEQRRWCAGRKGKTKKLENSKGTKGESARKLEQNGRKHERQQIS
jgi:hypothetical protein